MAARTYERLAELSVGGSRLEPYRLSRANYFRSGEIDEGRRITDRLLELGLETIGSVEPQGPSSLKDLAAFARLTTELSILFWGFFMLVR